MTSEKCELIAHLYRRAGFGVTKDELRPLASKNYEEIVESLEEPIIGRFSHQKVIDPLTEKTIIGKNILIDD